MEHALYDKSRKRSVRSDLFEYILVIAPPVDLSKKILKEKKYFLDKYHGGDLLQPQITVSNFLAHDEMEDTLIRWSQRAMGEVFNFEVRLNNYSGHPSHSIFLRVQDPVPFNGLVKSLKIIDSYISDHHCEPTWFISRPSIAIAGRLDQSTYDLAMKEYSKKMFYASFIVKDLLLLKRKHTHERCVPVAKFNLQPKEVLI